MNYSFFVVVVFFCVFHLALAALGGMPGGWSAGDVQDEAVKEIAEFAVNQQYGDSAVVNKIIEVSTQVVKGVNYEVLLEVAFHGKHHNTCIVEKFTIWDELGTKHLMSQELMPIDCEKHHIRQ